MFPVSVSLLAVCEFFSFSVPDFFLFFLFFPPSSLFFFFIFTVFNRMREYEEEITRDMRVGKGALKGQDARSIDASPAEVSKQLKSGRPI